MFESRRLVQDFCASLLFLLMRRIFGLFFIALSMMLVMIGCGSGKALAERVPPTAVSISNESGDTIAVQEGPVWVVLSGVDEHGLIVEHELTLLSEPDPNAAPGSLLHTGIPASVLEIRQGGPQNLQRFYHVETVDGVTGWISDYYVRRVAYLYDAESDGVDLYSSPDGQLVSRLPNVSPISVKEPSAEDWWLVQSVADGTLGWVAAEFVKESPAPEFLLDLSHTHE